MANPPPQLSKEKLEEELANLEKREGGRRANRRERSRSQSLSPRSRALARAQLKGLGDNQELNGEEEDKDAEDAKNKKMEVD